MAAEEVVKVTVHQAEWGDTRGEAPPPSGPSTPVKEDEAPLVFQPTSVSYGDNLNARIGARSGISYQPGTRLRGFRNAVYQGLYRPASNYQNAGKPMRTMYRPNIRYGLGNNSRNNIQYGFNGR
jgi:hypothetical protein